MRIFQNLLHLSQNFKIGAGGLFLKIGICAYLSEVGIVGIE